MFEIVDSAPQNAVIKVIGVGGGGGNAVEHMVKQKIEGVEFVCANTDAQALTGMGAPTLLQLGDSVTRGLGAGANPVVGKEAALEDRDRIKDILSGTDMFFIAAGMGGGTGTGAAPIVADMAKELGILTVAVVTRPFDFEGKKRMTVAEEGILELSKNVDSLITIPNQKLLSISGEDTPLLEAFATVDDVVSSAVQGIADLIIRPGMINVDFADVKTVMSERGSAMMGNGIATGDARAREAAESAVKSPLLADIDFTGARGVLVNIAASSDITMGEFSEVGSTVQEFASDNATVVVGTVIDESMNEEMRVTVVATGLVDNSNKNDRFGVAPEEMRPVAGDGERDYKIFDKPTNQRRKSQNEKSGGIPKPLDNSMEYLDIPAFLRRQAD
ncbi:MAG: cell division protein FtsZ [Pseudomonadota bacterium]|nr:cell division protein FtsZ [Pseudomonadota bacterium]